MQFPSTAYRASTTGSLPGLPRLERPTIGRWRLGRSSSRCSCRWSAGATKALFRRGQEEPPISGSGRLSYACPRTWVSTRLGSWGGVSQPGVTRSADRPYLQPHRLRLADRPRLFHQPCPADKPCLQPCGPCLGARYLDEPSSCHFRGALSRQLL